MQAERDSWYWKLRVDDALFALLNTTRSVQDLLRSNKNIRPNSQLVDRHRGKRCFILATGPSISSEDLTLLSNEIIFAGNFFYRHHDFDRINPTYYVIQDGKLVSGAWPMETIIDRVRAAAPEVTFLLNEAFAANQTLLNLLGSSRRFWIRANRTLHLGYRGSWRIDRAMAQGGNVIHIAVGAAASMGFKEIYLLGVDGNGLVLDLTGQPSHFYGGPPENTAFNHEKIERDLIMSGYGFRFWRAIDAFYRSKGVRIINLSKGSLLTGLETSSLSEVMGATTGSSA